MSKLKARIEALINSRAIQSRLRDKAVRRMKARHAGQVKAERQADAVRKAADELRAEAQQYLGYDNKQDVPRGERLARKALRKDRKVGRLEVKAQRECGRAVEYKQVARRKAQLIDKIDVSLAAAERKLATMKPHLGPDGKVAGASGQKEAADFVAINAWHECAAGKRPNFYSMYNPGFNVKHGLEPNRSTGQTGQLYGERSDCSVFVTEVAYAAGLPDPNGTDWTAGYTGTQQAENNGWREVTRATMERRGFGFVIYGSGVGHHVEWFIGNGKTIGHGTAAVDPGVVDLFGDGDYRCFVLN